ncbi:MAG: homocysteine S-methyltransferase family protein [Bacteroidia bacterium]|nr:homocysteine S-methyltransferase family protein [Bacteroidia bacterium]
MDIEELIKTHELVLMEGAVIERLRRSEKLKLHPTLLHTPLIYEKNGRIAMKQIFDEYIDIAEKAGTPIFICTPTWRADKDRVKTSGVDPSINIHGVDFIKEIRATRGSFADNIKIGGLIGCKNDCYQPEESLSLQEAEQYHTWQIDQLVKGGVDFLIAETLPNLQEAIGIASALSKSSIPYFISFVIARDGRLLDGTPLHEAILKVDKGTSPKPLGYMINCAYPTFLCANQQPHEVFKRLIGYLANASSLDHCDLDSAEHLEVDDISEWGNAMLELNKRYGVKVLGGCCGTGAEHLNYIAFGKS